MMKVLQNLLFVAAALPTASAGAPPLADLRLLGSPQAAFTHAAQACEAWDVPDAPARAVRVAPDRVLLFATHFRNRAASGRTLEAVRHDCRVVYAAAESGDPARFDDRAWIAGVHVGHDGTLVAVLHTEFQGHRHAGLCPTGRYLDCWYNALTLAVSRDGGAHFTRSGVAASLPYRYDQVVGVHRGYFGFSGFVARDGVEYAMTFAAGALAQRAGNCLLRITDPADAATWRGWDGHAFTVRFVNPYAAPVTDLETHVCAPVGQGALRWPVTGLVRHAPSGRFLAVMMDTAHGGGVYVSSSADLLAWTPPQKVLAASGPAGWRCGEAAPIDYPSLLDLDSPSPDFDTISDRALLFYTRFNPTGCRLLADRDLLRTPVTVLRPPGSP